MLKRQKGESLAKLLSRLNLAIAGAQIDDIFTDEIDPGKLQTALTLCILWLRQGRSKHSH